MISPFAQIYSSDPTVKDDFVSLIAEQFTRAGGVVSISEWAAMTDQERGALVEARDKIEAERAETIARMIILGPPATDEEAADAGAAAADELAGALS